MRWATNQLQGGNKLHVSANGKMAQTQQPRSDCESL